MLFLLRSDEVVVITDLVGNMRLINALVEDWLVRLFSSLCDKFTTSAGDGRKDWLVFC